MKTKARAAKTKESKRLTLKDRLSRLTYYRACQALGARRAAVDPPRGGLRDIDIDRDVYFRGDLFRLKLRGAGGGGKDAVVTITTMAEAKNRLRFNCTACQTICEHIGAAVSLVLEEKTALGLAAEPDERRPLETLSEQELLEQALRDRQERARTEKFRLHSSDPQQPVDRLHDHQRASGKTYRVALRGEERGQFVLLVSRLPHQHAGHLQAHSARAAIACGGVFRPRRGEGPIATARPSSTCSTARNSRSTCNCPIGPIPNWSRRSARWPTGRSTTCGGWSIAWRGWIAWAATSRSIPTPRS